ncbi:signal peptidase I [Actinoalloteichus spitiensis]|uniref:signal peptidase I n=1 Tax=Actinoalloteichus spitiensis TaxID=252394 RepID=UPI00047521BA
MPSNTPQGDPDQPKPDPAPRPGSEQGPPSDGGRHSSEPVSDEAGPGDGDGAGKKEQKKGSFWRELVVLVGIAVVLTVVIQAFIARVYVIPSQSMEETLHGCHGCTNDRVLVDKVTYRFTDPSPGDVVVFRGPASWTENEIPPQRSENPVVSFFQSIGGLVGMAPPDNREFVKRVIATGGQTVECCDERNRVLVDGEPLDESYVYWQPNRGNTQEEFGPVTVPADHLWMMGDNRNNSLDSRVQGGGGERGAVPVDDVIGKARFIVLPPQRWQGIGDDDPQQAGQALSAPAWHGAIPAGLGLAAAFPTLWIGRRVLSLRRRDD